MRWTLLKRLAQPRSRRWVNADVRNVRSRLNCNCYRNCGGPASLFGDSTILSRPSRHDQQRMCFSTSSSTTSGSKNLSPLQHYETLLSGGALRDDARQRQIMQTIETLYSDLREYFGHHRPASTAQSSPSSFSFFSKFSSVFSSSSSSSNQSSSKVNGNGISNTPKGLYLYGGVGCGKTMMMDMLHQALLASSNPPVRSLRTHFHTFMLDIHADLHRLRSQKGNVTDPLPVIAAQFVQNHGEVLLLDEFQVTDVADAMILRHLFHSLWANGCVVVATSNRPPQDLYANGINRSVFVPFIDDLQSNCLVVQVEEGADHRLLGTIQQGTYQTPVTPETEQRIQTIYKTLCGDSKSSSRTLNVRMGRTISIPEASSNDTVAMFTFEDLCDKPLSAADYMAIAETFTYVIVKNVPILTYDRRERIRRLIVLLDVFYENGVRLIVSAAESPENLFQPAPSGEHSNNTNSESSKSPNKSQPTNTYDEVFASSRAVSRLIEMQTVEYLRRPHIKKGAAPILEEAIVP